MEPDRHPEDAAELDMGFHRLPSAPQKTQKEQMCLKKCLRPLPAGSRLDGLFSILYKL
jgi:hypothetical protein